MVILIPAYEPDRKLIALLLDIRTADPEVPIVVVDDGSGPTYEHVFDEAADHDVVILSYPANHGKGHALKTGFGYVQAEHPGAVVVCADSDGQHSVADIFRVARRAESSGTAMVLGVRGFDGAVPARSRMGNTLTRWLFRLATGVPVSDTQTGLRAYPATMLPWLQSVDGDRFEYELKLLLQATRAGHGIESVQISTIYLEDNKSSHFRPFVDSIRVYLPLLMFSLSSLFAFAVDTAALLVLSAFTGSLLFAVVGARVLSSVVNFGANRRIVFARSRDKPARVAAVQYFALVVVLLAVNYSLLLSWNMLGLPLLLGKVITETTLFAISFLVQRRVVFARAGTPDSLRCGNAGDLRISLLGPVHGLHRRHSRRHGGARTGSLTGAQSVTTVTAGQYTAGGGPGGGGFPGP